MIYKRKIAMHPDRNDMFLARGEFDGYSRWCYTPWDAQDIEGYSSIWLLKQAGLLGASDLRVITLELEVPDV